MLTSHTFVPFLPPYYLSISFCPPICFCAFILGFGHLILITVKGWHILYLHLYNSHTPSEWNDMLHGGIT
jgi:hypothetical protein